MAIRGSLAEASVADVLQLLAIGRKTGCLSVANRTSFGRVYFDQGIIAHASILNRRDRLGDLLARNGLVDPAELAEALAEQNGRRGPRLGEILVRRGSTTPEQIEQYVRLQIEEAVYTLFTWSEGTFHFEPEEVPDEGELLVALNPESVLLEGARRLDEWTLIEKRIPSADLVFRIDRSHGEPQPGRLSAQERRILPLLDGSRSVAEVVEASGLPEFDAMRALFGLVQAGYARHEGRKRGTAPEAEAETIEEQRSLGRAFYRTGMLLEAERVFTRILEEDPADADALFRLTAVLLRQGAHRASIRRLMRAIELTGGTAAAFHNLALALEAEGRLQDALLTVEEGLRTTPDDRPLLLSRAILLTRLRRPFQACAAFQRLDDAGGPISAASASYYAYLVIALAAAGRTGEASQRALEGLRAYPRDRVLLVHAAVIADRLGDVETAERYFRRALSEDPELAQAQRGLAEILFRRGSYQEARMLLGKLLEGGRAGPEVRFLLGQIAHRLGNRQEALDHWRATVEQDPGHEAARAHLELVGWAGTPERR